MSYEIFVFFIYDYFVNKRIDYFGFELQLPFFFHGKGYAAVLC